jgi:glycosyltransferase involved in cell wall biosynthesis
MLRALIRDLGLRQTSIHTTPEDLGQWYSSASLLLVTSRLESFSLVLAEAMLSGVVPIAYASDGPSFILENFPDHLVEIGDVAGLSDRLMRLAGSADLDPLRRELSASISARFSPNVIIERWNALLSKNSEA